MRTFLELTAHDLYKRTGGDMSRLTVVFPNKRAALFFNDCLAKETSRPVWTPRYLTISEFFCQCLPTLQIGDPIKLVCDLHKVFRRVTGSDETLDDFYFWGETLISDFDDADKNLVDTSRLFSNIRDLNNLSTDTSYLSPDQREALSLFFKNFSLERETELKRRFCAIWNSLGEIYDQYKALLLSEGIAYEGMIYRRVIENLNPSELSSSTYAFVGFNVLNKVEQTLFSMLNSLGRALFYWDYDSWYVDNPSQEAGEFLRRNLQQFPSCLPKDCFDNLRIPKEIEFVKAPTETAQAHYLPAWAGRYLTRDDERRTAVVLCNENLLLPLLHSIPEFVSDINITMGYPLTQTPAYATVVTLLEANAGKPNLDLCRSVCQSLKDQTPADELTVESLYRAYTIFSRFSTLIECGDLVVMPHTFRRLVNRVFSSATIPFHGEPAKGMQILGVLETRNLDFRNVLMLSVNEGNIPKGESATSFVPYNLRKAFGMTTVDHRISVYAYYFYRILQRAEHVTLAYNTTTDGLGGNEMSRFMLQLLTELPYKITMTSTRFKVGMECDGSRSVNQGEAVLSLPSTPEVRQQIPLTLSPTALNTYLNCRMKFYFRYIARLSVPEAAGEISPSQFGSIFHYAAQQAFDDMSRTSKIITSESLDKLLANEARLVDYVDKAFREVLCVSSAYDGATLMVSNVVVNFFKRLLKYDKLSAPFTYVSSENKVYCSFQASEGKRVRIGGIIDRIDIQGDSLRIVDYKTGGKPAPTPDIETLFSRGGKREDHIFQTLVYSYVYSQICNPVQKVAPSLYYIQSLLSEGFSPHVKIGKGKDAAELTDFSFCKEEFGQRLKNLIEEIFSPETVFDKTDDEEQCKFCDFKGLCER